jgi:uncharacterized protein involved in response to NO
MAYRLLFPLATSYALTAVPLWLVPGLALKGIAQLAGNIPLTGMLYGSVSGHSAP